MEPKQDLTVWQSRWELLDESLKNIIDKFEIDDFLKDVDRRQTICHLLKGLKVFGQSHFRYFYNGLKQKNSKPDLTDKDFCYPPVVILRSIIEQISFDLEVLSRAIEQRRLDGTYGNIYVGLKKADKLAQMALQPAIDCQLISADTTVLTYFQKTYSVRVVPYAKVAIIGIPYTALTVPRDYLAIPHEVAHYIFRHGIYSEEIAEKPETYKSFSGRGISSVLNEIFNEKSKFLRNWIEEIFADVYGCLIAGPVMAIDFQDLQLDDPIDAFVKAYIDFEDPTPIIRPDIYSKILHRTKNEDWTRLAGLLEERWESYRAIYWESYEKKQQTNQNVEIIQLENLNGEPEPYRITTRNNRHWLHNIRDKDRGINAGKPLGYVLFKMWEMMFNSINEAIKNNQKLMNWSGEKLGEIENVAALEKLYEKSADALKKEINVVFPILDCNLNINEMDEALAKAGLPKIHPIWVKSIMKWTRRHQFDAITEENKVQELLETERLPETDSGATKWGWVELVNSDGWVTRGPEPNPVGG